MNTDTIGVYGNYYLKRAVVALIGLGANQPDDAIYSVAVSDSDGNPIMAENKYVLHFSKDELPPVDAFWSLTMYDAEGFQIANSINRFAIGDRDPLSFNGDGSLDLYIQNENPGSDAPTRNRTGYRPRGVAASDYAPRPQVANGNWDPPAIRRVN
jgi:hypothetical protein